MGDDGDLEGSVLGVDDGETDAVKADGAFFGEIAGFFGSDVEGEEPGVWLGVDFGEGSGLVDVALDEVAPEAVGGAHGAF